LGALGIYVTLMLHLVPGAAAERLGVLEELPPEIGIWKVDDSAPDCQALVAQGIYREVRMFHQLRVGWSGGERLVRQTRYRDIALVELSVHRLAADLLGVVEALSSLRTGSIVVTYCGLGGPIPSSFDLISEELVSSGCLRTWIKRRSYEGDWYHLDRQDDVARATRGYVDRRLRHPARSPGRNV
jgi:hypothetical protein